MNAEAQAQSEFLAALFKHSPTIAGATPLHADSLQAYRGNLSASVERALGAMYPTVQHLLGLEDFDALAQLYLTAHLPLRGDWAQYGKEFASWLHRENPGGVTTALPFLPDLAALDAAIYHAEAAADAPLEAGTLQALTGDATHLKLVFHPTLTLLECGYAVLDFLNEPSPNPAQGAHTLQIWRSGWRAHSRVLPAREAMFVRLCLAGATLYDAVQQANALRSQEVVFDIEQWLSRALQDMLLVRVETLLTPPHPFIESSPR